MEKIEQITIVPEPTSNRQRGYFNTPRDVTMADLGDELGISQQAVASRLRRGISSILGSSLAELPPPE